MQSGKVVKCSRACVCVLGCKIKKNRTFHERHCIDWMLFLKCDDTLSVCLVRPLCRMKTNLSICCLSYAWPVKIHPATAPYPLASISFRNSFCIDDGIHRVQGTYNDHAHQHFRSFYAKCKESHCFIGCYIHVWNATHNNTCQPMHTAPTATKKRQASRDR